MTQSAVTSEGATILTYGIQAQSQPKVYVDLRDDASQLGTTPRVISAMRTPEASQMTITMRASSRYGCSAAILLALSLTTPTAGRAQTELVRPSAADSNVHQYDNPSVVVSRGAADRDAPLAIFLTGTHGRPEMGPKQLVDVIAGQGYRVINLSYDDEPAVNQICPRNPNPQCSYNFREMRTFGVGRAPVSNPPAEAIVPRLVALLRYLDHEHPDAGWAAYLGSDGQPAWNRILVSGLSQGAGMAAFIAKRYPVYRVVLFSSPWDTTGRDQRPAPWLSTPSATPPDRWWAERHARERTTDLIANAYRALRIPPDHILIFEGGLPPNSRQGSENPYHGSTVRMPEYADKWRQLYRHAQ